MDKIAFANTDNLNIVPMPSGTHVFGDNRLFVFCIGKLGCCVCKKEINPSEQCNFVMEFGQVNITLAFVTCCQNHSDMIERYLDDNKTLSSVFLNAFIERVFNNDAP